MKITPLLLASAIILITAGRIMAAPIQVIRSLPAIMQGEWCPFSRNDERGLAELIRCKDSRAPLLTITEFAVSDDQTSCRFGSVFAWVDGQNWHAMAECSGAEAHDHRLYQMISTGRGRGLIFQPFHTFDPAVSQPAPFRITRQLPQEAMGKWCYQTRDDRFAYFRRCKAIDKTVFVLTPKVLDQGASSCRFEEVFAAVDGLGWRAFAACRGKATGLRVYQIDSQSGPDMLALHIMDDGPTEDDGVQGRR
jgi:hypothetical protein